MNAEANMVDDGDHCAHVIAWRLARAIAMPGSRDESPLDPYLLREIPGPHFVQRYKTGEVAARLDYRDVKAAVRRQLQWVVDHAHEATNAESLDAVESARRKLHDMDGVDLRLAGEAARLDAELAPLKPLQDARGHNRDNVSPKVQFFRDLKRRFPGKGPKKLANYINDQVGMGSDPEVDRIFSSVNRNLVENATGIVLDFDRLRGQIKEATREQSKAQMVGSGCAPPKRALKPGPI